MDARTEWEDCFQDKPYRGKMSGCHAGFIEEDLGQEFRCLILRFRLVLGYGRV
jgi:hypothetical protein